MKHNTVFTGSRLAVLGLLLLPAGLPTAAAAALPPVVSKWQRFEQAFRSSFIYSNALQDAWLKVKFISPLGETNEVDGFWDGGRTWRVRFAPDLPGRWTFRTTCSDKANDGLHDQIGELLCTAAIGPTRFHRHGPVRVSLDHRHFEHADGTPFFWLADTVWAGARAAQLKEWEFYAGTRASQRFTVAQWSVAPGQDLEKQSAYSGFPERIAINPDFFKRLDARVDVLREAGILSAIAPLAELRPQENVAPALTDDQAELLVRYVVARWGADPVAWLLAFEGESAGKNVGRWKRIGQAVFDARAHAPVVLYPGETQWVFDEFRDQAWVDVFGYQNVTDVTEDAVKWAVAGPFAAEWTKEPVRPLITFAPCENGVARQSRKRFTSDDVRHAVYWGLLLAPPAGVSYCGQGVADWDLTFGPGAEEAKGTDLPMWRKAMFMPAAKEMGHLAKLMNAVDFWKLQPQPKLIVSQPGNASPGHFIASASADPNTLSLVYVPGDRTLEVTLAALPESPSVGWFNPRTGESNPAAAVVGGSTCQFATPDRGDWLFVARAGK